MALPKRQLTPDNDTEETVLGGAPEQTQQRTSPEETEAARVLRNLNFKVPPSFRKRFKDRANAEDIPGVELLKRALEAYERQQGAA